MKNRLILLIFSLPLIFACVLVPPLTASPAVPPSSTPVLTLTPIPSVTTTIAPAASATSTPTATSLSTLSVDYYHLRLEYRTTSDWSTLEIPNYDDYILTMKWVERIGEPTQSEVRLNQLSLNQPLQDAESGQTVGLIVDLALSPNAIQQPLALVLRKGDIGQNFIRLSLIGEGQTQLIQEFTHAGVVPNSGGLNPLSVEVDLSPLKVVAPTHALISHPTPKMLWAFYYPWYSRSDWSSPLLKDRPITQYASNDPDAILRHIEQAQQAGIDGFLSSWWGPGDYTDQNLKLLLQTARQRNFSIAINFETLKEDGPRDEEEIYRWLVYLLDNYRDNPAFFKVNGKPVIVVWASGTIPLENWQALFARLRANGRNATFIGMGYGLANLAVFDGIHEYAIFAIPNLSDVYQSVGNATRFYSILSDDSINPKIWAATVQPGYDDRLIPGREGQLQDRQDGQFYRSTFEAALLSDPDWIFITSWNEWWEHTYIEPSELYGDLYLQITRQYAEKWKRNE